MPSGWRSSDGLRGGKGRSSYMSRTGEESEEEVVVVHEALVVVEEVAAVVV